MCVNKHYRSWITSGRSDVEGRKPMDLAERTELRTFSPTFDKSIPPPQSPAPPWENRSEPKKKNLESSKPSGFKLAWLKAIGINANGDAWKLLGCISNRGSGEVHLKPHLLRSVNGWGFREKWDQSFVGADGLLCLCLCRFVCFCVETVYRLVWFGLFLFSHICESDKLSWPSCRCHSTFLCMPLSTSFSK